MPPVKLTCTVGGKERGSVIAEDGVTASLDTPVGRASATMEKPQRLGASFSTLFPGDGKVVYPETLSRGVLNDIKDTFRRRQPPPERKKEYQTLEGRVVIKAEGIKE